MNAKFDPQDLVRDFAEFVKNVQALEARNDDLQKIIDEQHAKLNEIKAAHIAAIEARDAFRKKPDPHGLLDGEYIDSQNRLAAILNSL